MIRTIRRLGSPTVAFAANPCPPGLVVNGDSCVDPATFGQYSIVNCPPNTQVLAPGGGPASLAQQMSGQYVCAPMPAPILTLPPVPTTPAPAVRTPRQPKTTTAVVTPGVRPAAGLAPSPTNYSSAEIVGSAPYTADLELVQNTMYEYGDTWDNAQTIVDNLYASGTAPGTITSAQALNALTGIAGATVPVAFGLSSIPWYVWAGGAAALFFFAGGSGKH